MTNNEAHPADDASALFERWGRKGFREDDAPQELKTFLAERVRRTVARYLAANGVDAPIDAQAVAAETANEMATTLPPHGHAALKALLQGLAATVLSENEPHDVTRLLWVWKGGQHASSEALENALFNAVKDYLQIQAARTLRRPQFSSLQHRVDASELLSDLYIRLRDYDVPQLWENRKQFYGMTARALETVLLDIRKAASRGKRQRTQFKVSLSHAPHLRSNEIDIYHWIDRLSRELEKIDPEQRQIFELRAIHGRSVRETAAVLSISEPTVKRKFAFARQNLIDLLR